MAKGENRIVVPGIKIERKKEDIQKDVEGNMERPRNELFTTHLNLISRVTLKTNHILTM